jgi:phosphocarrier protein HPr
MATAERTLKITNKLGLHARAAAKLVQMAARFKSEVKIARVDAGKGSGAAQANEVNAKSIMGVLMLAAANGTTVRLGAEGEDAEEAVAALVSLIEGKFGEE